MYTCKSNSISNLYRNVYIKSRELGVTVSYGPSTDDLFFIISVQVKNSKEYLPYHLSFRDKCRLFNLWIISFISSIYSINALT